MTIILNAPYATFAGGSTVTLDNATEAALVAQGRASYSTNPGAVFQPLTAQEQQSLRPLAISSSAAALQSVAAPDGTVPSSATARSVRSMSSRQRLVAFVGDSITSLGAQYGYDIGTQNGTIGGVPYYGMHADMECPSGAGTLTLSGGFLTWTPNSSTAGAPVSASRSGVLYVPGPSAQQGIWISWLATQGAATSGTASITVPANGNQQWGWKAQGHIVWYLARCLGSRVPAYAPAFTVNGRVREAVHAFFGARTDDIIDSQWQWSQTYADDWHVMIGRNDIGAGRTFAQITANLTTIYRALVTQGAGRVFVYEITPAASGDTSAQKLIRTAVNRWIYAYAQANANFVFVPSAQVVTNPANGAWLTNYNTDTLHPAAPGAWAIGDAAAAADGYPAGPIPYIGAYEDVYDATNNPNGCIFATAGLTVMGNTGGTQGTNSATAPAWVTTTAYTINQIVTSNSNLYLCTTAGTSGATGPSHTQGFAVDGTVTWQYLGVGSGALAAGLTSQQDSGTIAAQTGKVTRTGGLQRQVISVTCTSSGDHNLRTATTANGNLSIGGTTAYELLADITILGISGTPTKFTYQLYPNDAAFGKLGTTLIGALPNNIPAGTRFVFRSPAWYVPSSAVGVSARLLTNAGTGGTVAYALDAVSLRPVQ